MRNPRAPFDVRTILTGGLWIITVGNVVISLGLLVIGIMERLE